MRTRAPAGRGSIGYRPSGACGRGLNRRVRAGTRGAAFRQELVVPTLSALREAFALRERIRLLDGLYISLALQRDATLVTTDARLARANPPCTTWSPV